MARVLILGATSTVALDVARQLARRGDEVLLLARDEARLRAIVDELGPCVLAFRSVDFLDIETTQRCLAEVLGLGEVDVVLIAQGYLGDQQQSERDFAEAERQMAVNYTSVVAQLIAVTEQLERQGHGQIVVLSSVAGDRGRPRNYTYGSAKGALSLYLQGLRSRLWPKIPVTTVKLGPVITKMSAGHPQNATFITSPQAARGIISALDRRAAEVYVPGFYRYIMVLVRMLPEGLFQRLGFLSGR